MAWTDYYVSSLASGGGVALNTLATAKQTRIAAFNAYRNEQVAMIDAATSSDDFPSVPS